MVTNEQFRRLMKLMKTEKTLAAAAAKAGMDEKTARKYRDGGVPPSELARPHTWRTRPDVFAEVWPQVAAYLKDNAGLEAKTLFEWLQREDPGRFPDAQLRTFQRRVKLWRALEGPPQEVMFPQEHFPGRLAQSDFTHMDKLGVKIAGQPFPHLIYHFVLTYSNWETGTVCFSESFESLSEGLQRALWELGGVPLAHRTDRLTTAVRKTNGPREFTDRYGALLSHYGLEGKKTQARSPNENGDVEQRHHRLKRAIAQALMLRGSRDFASRAEYEVFLRDVFARLNAGRRNRFEEEREVLGRLPATRLETCTALRARVTAGSTIYVQKNIYSVPSRLIGEMVKVRLFAERVEIWHGQRLMETLPRLRGQKRHRIDYRHVIGSLVRKPGAFENYRYRDDMFPSSWFRLAYDSLRRRHCDRQATREYLKILAHAAEESESLVEDAIGLLLGEGETLSSDAVIALARSRGDLAPPTAVAIGPVDLGAYDLLLSSDEEVETWPRSRTPQLV